MKNKNDEKIEKNHHRKGNGKEMRGKDEEKEMKKYKNYGINNNQKTKKKYEYTRYINGNHNFYLLLLFLIISESPESISKNIYTLNNSILTMRLTQEGNHKIFSKSPNSPSTPTKVYINDILQEGSISNIYPFNPGDVFKLEWEEDITDCESMFYECNSIVEINFIEFDISRCTNTNKMFRNCKSLISLDLTKLNFQNVKTMCDMFWDCQNLTSLDLSNLDTQNVVNMGHLFCNCKSLISLNISNFNTTKVRYFDNMFNGCESLEILDFSNLQLPKNTDRFFNMFTNCNNLKYINFKNFDSYVNLTDNFLNGTNKYLIVNTRNSQLIDIITNNECSNIVSGEKNWYEYKKKINPEDNHCIDDCKMTNNYKYEYEGNCYQSCFNSTYNNSYKCEKCHPDCLECEGAYTLNFANCKICISEDKFLYLGNCISNCSRDIYTDETTHQKMCKCELNQCLDCSNESLNKNLCLSCDNENGYYPIYDDNYINNYSYINCSRSPEGYYLDKTDENYVYKLCYPSCKTCNISGNESNHNCIECKSNYNFDIGYYKNCYDNCSYYHYYNKSENIFYCTENFTCPNDYDKLIEDKRECVSDCSNDENYKYEFRKKCYKDNCPSNSTERNTSNELERYFCKPICDEKYPFEIINTQECVEKCDFKYFSDDSCIINYKSEENIVEIYNMILKMIESYFTSGDYDTLFLEQGNNEVFEFENIKVTLTTAENQLYYINNSNETAIDLGECQKLLREAYYISPNETLYMKKIDVKQEGMKIPKVEFDVYNKINGTNLFKLDLSYCENSKVNIFYPIIKTDSIDKLNSSSDYYNDLCYTATSDSGTDITLNDRKKEFVEKNKTVCQDDCIFSEYDNKNQKTRCLCDVKKSSSSIENIRIDKTKLYKNFIDIKNIANINLLVCYKVLFSKNGILHNYGNFILIPIILAHFIIIFIFYKKKFFKTLKNQILDISFGIKNSKIILENGTIKENFNITDIGNIKFKNQNEKEEESKKSEINNFININIQSYPPKKKNKIKSIKMYLGRNTESMISKQSNNINLQMFKTMEITKLERRYINKKYPVADIDNLSKKIKNIMAYNNEELNGLSYELALKYDKRNYCQYYFSLLKAKHIILFTFFNNNDYNSKIIKIDLFLFNLTLFISINALFFSDETMHKIHEDKGIYNFIFQLPQIIYSSLISFALGFFIELLALSQDLILNFKKQKEINNLHKNKRILIKNLRRKFLLYFIFSSLFQLFFWYYLSMFCAIYRNTQIHLIKDTLLSFILSLFIPFAIYLIPGIFRISALSDGQNKRTIMYKISQFIQIF